jgi:hypothetical protein
MMAARRQLGCSFPLRWRRVADFHGGRQSGAADFDPDFNGMKHMRRRGSGSDTPGSGTDPNLTYDLADAHPLKRAAAHGVEMVAAIKEYLENGYNPPGAPPDPDEKRRREIASAHAKVILRGYAAP